MKKTDLYYWLIMGPWGLGMVSMGVYIIYTTIITW